MRLRADTTSPKEFIVVAVLSVIAVLTLVYRLQASLDYRFTPLNVECLLSSQGQKRIPELTDECHAQSSRFEVKVLGSSINGKGSFAFPRLLVLNPSSMGVLDIGYKMSVIRVSGGSISDMNLEWTDKQAKAICDKRSCISDILVRLEPEQGTDFIYKIELHAIQDNQGVSIDVQKLQDVKLQFFKYSSKDGTSLFALKFVLVILSIICFIFFTRSLKTVRLQDKLTVQMFTKYLGFLIIFFNFPLFMGNTRTKNIIAIVLMLFESLFFSYLIVFFLIMMPSIANEHSTVITQYNTGWKKIFLLAYFALCFAVKVNDFYQVENSEGRDLTDTKLYYLRLAYSAMTLFAAIFSIIFAIKAFRRTSQLETRNKTLLALILPVTFLASISAIFLGRNPCSQETEILLHIGLFFFIFGLEYFYSKIEDIVDGSQQQTALPHKMEIYSTGKQISADSIGTTEDSREDTESHYHNNKSIDEVKKPVDKHEEEEVSYEIENEDH